MGDPGEKKYIKKKIRPGAIVLDPRETAIVVQYELEGQLLAPDGVTVITELSDGTKRIKVKKLDRRTDIQALADEIVTTCKLIHHSKTGKVRSLLAELRDRTANASSGAKTRKDALEVVHETSDEARRSRAPSRNPRLANTRDRDAHLSARADDPAAKTLDAIVAREDRRLLAEAKADFLGAAHDVVATTSAPLVSEIGSSGLVSRLGGRFGGGRLGVGDTGGNDTKSMHEHIDAHLELLYDDDPATRAEGVAGVARFAAEAKNLATLAAHETLPQTLARVLREDGRRSADIATNVMAVFFALSNASAFHGLILGNQVGDATLRVVDLELRRAAERRKTQKYAATVARSSLSLGHDVSSDDDDIDAFEARRVVKSEKKRDALLYVAFYLLLNVAEDVAVERKMKKRDVVRYLMECVGTRGDVDLLVLCVTFLRKLSVRRENVEEMLRGGVLDGERSGERSDSFGTSGEKTQNERNEGSPFRDDVVARVARFLADGVPDVLVSATLRLLLNVSFHERARDAMHERALLPRLCVLARDATHQNVALALLYHASVDAKRRRFFAVARPVSGTDLVIDLLLKVSETSDSVAHSAPTVAAIAVNLSADARCAEALAGYENGKPFLAFLAGRARSKDALGLKIARNVFRRAGDLNECPSVVRVVKAAIRDSEGIFQSLIDGFLLEDPPGTDVAIEMLGLLTDAHRPATDEALDASVACENAGVFERVAAYLTPHETEDDAALEAVLFCSAFASKHDARNASIFVKTGIAESLYELLREKKDDDAFVLAIVTTFAAFLAFPETRDVVLNNTQTVFYLVELLRDECAAIRDAADAALDVVVDEGGEQWAVKVRRARFEAHNREWLDAVSLGGFASFGEERNGNDERRGRRYSDDEETGGGGAFDGRGGSDASLVYDDPARYYDEAEEDDMYGY